jgi:hypothetical protein
MVIKLIGSALALLLLCVLSACSVKLEVGYHGKSGLDDRTVTPSMYHPAKAKF